MSIAENGTKSLDMLATALHGLDAIRELAKGKWTGGGRALELFSLILEVVHSIEDGFAGKADATTINDALLRIRTDLAANDASAESELDKKFPR